VKIIQIVVDKLPASASECFAAVENWNALSGFEEIGCRFTMNKAYQTVQMFYTQRCWDCPLIEAKESKNELPEL